MDRIPSISDCSDVCRGEWLFCSREFNQGQYSGQLHRETLRSDTAHLQSEPADLSTYLCCCFRCYAMGRVFNYILSSIVVLLHIYGKYLVCCCEIIRLAAERHCTRNRHSSEKSILSAHFPPKYILINSSFGLPHLNEPPTCAP